MEVLIISGSLQVFATVFRSLIPCPPVSSFFILFMALFRDSNWSKPGCLPEAHVFETLEKVLNEDLAEVSIFLTALAARGVIHSAVQTSAGSGVEAHALKRRSAGRRKTDRSMSFMGRHYAVS